NEVKGYKKLATPNNNKPVTDVTSPTTETPTTGYDVNPNKNNGVTVVTRVTSERRDVERDVPDVSIDPQLYRDSVEVGVTPVTKRSDYNKTLHKNNAIPDSAAVPGTTRCPQGGSHTWIKVGDGHLCSRCNAKE